MNEAAYTIQTLPVVAEPSPGQDGCRSAEAFVEALRDDALGDRRSRAD